MAVYPPSPARRLDDSAYDVVLLDLSQGMNEAARTKTDAQGRFSFNVPPAAGPRLVRVNHQGVNYFPAGGPIRPGTNATGLTVVMSETMAKSLELLKAAVPGLRRVAVIWDPATPSHALTSS